MNSHNETFDKLFEELERFSPEIDKSDLYVPPTHATSSQSSSSPLSNLNIRFLSQNVNKSNAITHSLLNSCGHNTDIFFIQEPWFDRIGIDIQTGIDKIGVPNHPQFCQEHGIFLNFFFIVFHHFLCCFIPFHSFLSVSLLKKRQYACY